MAWVRCIRFKQFWQYDNGTISDTYSDSMVQTQLFQVVLEHILNMEQVIGYKSLY